MREAALTPGQLARAADKRVGKLPACGPGGVSVPIVTRTNAQGLAELVHAHSGAVLGQCASAEIAQRTKEFLK